MREHYRHARGLQSLIWICVALVVPAAIAEIDVPSNGVDGFLDMSFFPEAEFVIDLAEAERGTWDQSTRLPGNEPSGSRPGKGVYDPQKWAVVFHLTTLNVPSGKTLRFRNNATRAPVVFLVQGNVTIAGTVVLDGGNQTGAAATVSEPGPGGFRGARARIAGANQGGDGFGPGGGQDNAQSGSYGTKGYRSSGVIYGNDRVLPLIGGSGGSSNYGRDDQGGAAGGGAILIAARQAIEVAGTVSANGGQGNYFYGEGFGSGGGIRLLADRILGSGLLRALGNNAVGSGRIRLEANEIPDTTLRTSPQSSNSLDPSPVVLWPEDLEALGEKQPHVQIQDVAGVAVPTDPQANLSLGRADLNIPSPTTGSIEIRVATRNVPIRVLPSDPPSWNVRVRLTFLSGKHAEYDAVLQSGNTDAATWLVVGATLPDGVSAIQARASKP
jgi:hypothetical protein